MAAAPAAAVNSLSSSSSSGDKRRRVDAPPPPPAAIAVAASEALRCDMNDLYELASLGVVEFVRIRYERLKAQTGNTPLDFIVYVASMEPGFNLFRHYFFTREQILRAVGLAEAEIKALITPKSPSPVADSEEDDDDDGTGTPPLWQQQSSRFRTPPTKPTPRHPPSIASA